MNTTSALARFVELTNAFAKAVNGHELDMGPRQALGLLVAHAEKVAKLPAAEVEQEQLAQAVADIDENLDLVEGTLEECLDSLTRRPDADDWSRTMANRLELIHDVKAAISGTSGAIGAFVQIRRFLVDQGVAEPSRGAALARVADAARIGLLTQPEADFMKFLVERERRTLDDEVLRELFTKARTDIADARTYYAEH